MPSLQRPRPDVLAEKHPRPTDAVDTLVGVQSGGCQVVGDGAHGEHASAVGAGQTIDQPRGRVEHLDAQKLGDRKAINDIALVHATGISPRGQHHAERGARIPLAFDLVEAVIERYGPEFHELAGRAKDMGSAAVFVLMMNVLLCWGLILGPRIF